MTGTFSRTAIPLYADTQGFLTISSAPAAAGALLGKRLIDAGAIDIAGDYECRFASDGMNIVEVEIMPSAVSGTVAPTLSALRYAGNFGSARTTMQDAGANLGAGIAQVLTVSDLRGKRVCAVSFTVGAGESVTFDPGTDLANPTALAEYCGL